APAETVVNPVPPAVITSNPREEHPEDEPQTRFATTSLVPSGFQAGSEAAVAGLSLVTSPPSGVIEASSYAPAYRVVANAIREPSGFQAGPASCPGSLVSRVNPVPFALMTQISLLPLSTSHVNASRVPSGDQAGPVPLARVTVFEPSAYATAMIAWSTDAPDWKAIFSTRTQVSWNVVRTVSRVDPPVVTCTVRGLLPASAQFPTAPNRMTL